MANRDKFIRRYEAENKKFLNDWFNEANGEIQQAVIKAVDDAAEKVIQGMEGYFTSGKLQVRSGTLLNELKDYRRAKVQKSKYTGRYSLVGANVIVEKKTLVTARDPGKINPNMEDRYAVSYGRLIEFSDRLNPNGDRDFFFGPWYDLKENVQYDIIKAIMEAAEKAGKK